MEQDSAGSEYDRTDDSDDEDSGMQGQARPVDVTSFPSAVDDDHEARVRAVQLQEGVVDYGDCPELVSSSSSDDTRGPESGDEEDEVDVQTSQFWTPSDAFLRCHPNGQQTF